MLKNVFLYLMVRYSVFFIDANGQFKKNVASLGENEHCHKTFDSKSSLSNNYSSVIDNHSSLIDNCYYPEPKLMLKVK